jgi:3'-phosphoadenosine 5'-phosphosulfate sulfotransferase (PAPS reductase)/FAD synthetase
VRHVVMFSGGLLSWAAAKRVVAGNGTGDVVLLFTDTRAEDGDLYRFLAEAAANVGVPLTLLDLRRRAEAGGQCDLFDWGGCGCFVDGPEAETDD